MAGHAFNALGGADDFAHVFAQGASGGQGVEDLFAVAGEDHKQIVGFVKHPPGQAGGGGGGGLVGGSLFQGRVGRRGEWRVGGPLDEDEVGGLIIPTLEAKELPVVMNARGEGKIGEETGGSEGGEFGGSYFEEPQKGTVAGDKFATGLQQRDWRRQESHDILVVAAL